MKKMMKAAQVLGINRVCEHTNKNYVLIRIMY